MVKDLKISIKEASQILGINYSTAKTILQLFRKSGRIDRLERKYHQYDLDSILMLKLRYLYI
jgi:transposase